MDGEWLASFNKHRHAKTNRNETRMRKPAGKIVKLKLAKKKILLQSKELTLEAQIAANDYFEHAKIKDVNFGDFHGCEHFLSILTDTKDRNCLAIVVLNRWFQDFKASKGFLRSWRDRS